MLLRTGTILRMFQEELQEPLITFSKRIETAAPTVNSYQVGRRNPPPDSGFRHKMERFLLNSSKEIGIDISGVEFDRLALDVIYLEYYFHDINENYRFVFQKAALETLVKHIGLLEGKSESTFKKIFNASTRDCIEAILKRNSEFTDKLMMAVFLAKLGINSNLFLDVDDYFQKRSFRNIEELVSFANKNNIIAEWPLAIDILMSLPAYVSLQHVIQNLFTIRINVGLDEIFPFNVTVEDRIFPSKKRD